MNAKGFICPRTVTACVWWRYNMPRTSDMTGNHPTIPCYGCGALVPNEDGPAHRYIGASPGCWAVYGEVLARASADPAWGDDQLLILNSYCAQHPGTPGPQATQSVCVHLIGLHVALEWGYDSSRVLAALRRAADGSHRFRWLAPPAGRYGATILDVRDASDPAAHRAAARAMAETTWAAWVAHRAQVAAWAAAVGLRP